MKLIAKTFQGLEEVLAKELEALGAVNVEQGRRMVAFEGDKAMLYRANLWLRTAVRVLKPILTFKAKNADEVYEAVKGVDWSDYLDTDTSLSVDSVVYSEEFRHSKFVSYKVKDAIIDYFRERTGKRPSISVTNPDLRLNMHISETDCTLSLDSSGESLHKRGYRVETVSSPINEVLAAGMVLLSGWRGERDLIDPMCGSGTIAIEAAMIAGNVAPGLFRKEFAFEKWRDFDKDLFEEVYNDDSKETEFSHHVYAYDIDPQAVRIAQENVASAGMQKYVTVEQRSIQQFQQPAEDAVIITNPPYGERVQVRDLLGLYRTIGEKLKHQFVGGEAWIIGYREEAFEQIGLKPSLKVPLYNGSLDCELRKYQIFNGKLEDFRAEGGILKTEEEKEKNAKKRKLKPRRVKEADADDNFEDEMPEYIVRRHKEFKETYGSGRKQSFRHDGENDGAGYTDRRRGGRSDGRARSEAGRGSDGRGRGGAAGYGSDRRGRGYGGEVGGRREDYGRSGYQRRGSAAVGEAHQNNYGSREGSYGSRRNNYGGGRDDRNSCQRNYGNREGGYVDRRKNYGYRGDRRERDSDRLGRGGDRTESDSDRSGRGGDRTERGEDRNY